MLITKIYKNLKKKKKKKIMNFLKSSLHFLSYLMNYVAIIKQLAPLLMH